MNIVLLDAKTLGDNSLAPLEQLGDFHSYELTEPQSVVTRCQDAEVIISNKVVINAEHMQSLPKLKLICVAATGTNNIDLQAAAEQGITVCNVAGYSTASVVQHTFALLNALLGNIHRYINDCHHGAWQQSDMFCRLDYAIEELADKTLAIIGYGELGQAVARVAEAFAMKVIVAERKGQPVREGRVSFEQALQNADVVSIHSPLTPQTQQLFNADAFALMKPSAVLINTARGPIIDEQALVAALEQGDIAGAALDVLTREPATADNPLIAYQGHNLLLTPHIAWASRQARDRLIEQLAKNIIGFANGEIRNQVS
ncbi:D-2-hydroxyacid dehydrogenase [Pseudoalteromonas sp. CNC9-20]|uniref:D-2-hydroxyacid dehydrogenase n=1 Tax=Pseudoalteromonas sp. CNC9-20 TaxID=2917750 RepID=UPI001EF625C8|nr:D-2-hydroxyacid dehydrogenase [Pseudoalteromonas sp. CNC9-20]MCG7570144.1 D-2-hydroxyacid dehydrogenase [Pseudoalteromonas sp. CNC9-20]